jgi:hypothetical protein
MSTTIDTITDKQIRGLRTEAIAAGDEMQAGICSLALGVTEYTTPATVASLAGNDFLTPEKDELRELARAECVRVIAEAEARS